MPVEVVGTPVEVTGAPVDIDANASARPPVVAGKPLTKQLTGLATSPTPESEQKGLLSLLAASAFQGIVPIIILSAYYQNEWSNAYCEETGLAEWALVFAWIGMGGVIYQLLANVWFWRINWKHFTTGGDAAIKQTLRRKKWLDISQSMVGLFNLAWFCYGQSAHPWVELAISRRQQRDPQIG